MLMPMVDHIPEYGVQLVRQDPYTPQQVVEAISAWIKRAIDATQ